MKKNLKKDLLSEEMRKCNYKQSMKNLLKKGYTIAEIYDYILIDDEEIKEDNQI